MAKIKITATVTYTKTVNTEDFKDSFEDTLQEHITKKCRDEEAYTEEDFRGYDTNWKPPIADRYKVENVSANAEYIEDGIMIKYNQDGEERTRNQRRRYIRMKVALLLKETLEEQYIFNPYFRTHRDQITDPSYQDEATEADILYANSLVQEIINKLKADAEALEQFLFK